MALLSGNEAVARGAWEAGARVATAYPGTPSTEIIQAASRYPEIHAEWCPNEKVALEVALGAAQGGARALCAMKHVGLNVAADPLLTAVYVGIRAGLVIVTADDPGMFSSQNEQDNRHYALLAKIPMFEPADSSEALLFTRLAFDLSEELDTPVLVRTTTRISHSSSLTEVGERLVPPTEPGFVRDRRKYVMIPGHARLRHPLIEQRMEDLAQRAEDWDVNRIEWGDRDLGVITGGAAYQYTREALPDASVLKLGLSHPLPAGLIAEFAAGVERLLVVEELDPIWETQVRSLGLDAHGKDVLPACGELSPDLVAAAAAAVLGRSLSVSEFPTPVEGLPGRPPVLCPGCPHRGAMYVLGKMDLVVMGDIGCYSLGVQPPLSAMDTLTCMGAGIGQAMGLELAAGPEQSRRTIAVIGDSTFVHSGITGLIEVVYNRGRVTVLLLDNGTTAMTGHQPNPATGRTAAGEQTHRLDLEALCRAVGVEHVRGVDPLDLEAVERAISEALAHDGPAVVITKRTCPLLDRTQRKPPLKVSDGCIACRRCLGLGCPAIEHLGPEVSHKTRTVRLMQINPTLCTGCGLCQQVCPTGAIGGEPQ